MFVNTTEDLFTVTPTRILWSCLFPPFLYCSFLKIAFGDNLFLPSTFSCLVHDTRQRFLTSLLTPPNPPFYFEGNFHLFNAFLIFSQQLPDSCWCMVPCAKLLMSKPAQLQGTCQWTKTSDSGWCIQTYGVRLYVLTENTFWYLDDLGFPR